MSAIEVNRESWHAKVYLWWYYAKWPNKKREREYDLARGYGEPKKSSNLCPYVRTVLFWAPCRWLFYQGKIGRIPVPYVFVPVILLSIPQPAGYLSYELKKILWAMDIILFGVALLALLVWGVAIVVDLLDQKLGWANKLASYKLEKRLRKEYEPIVPPLKKKTGPSFFSLIAQRISAAHDRICPEIEFKKFD
jgi:hypothetical protein